MATLVPDLIPAPAPRPGGPRQDAGRRNRARRAARLALLAAWLLPGLRPAALAQTQPTTTTATTTPTTPTPVDYDVDDGLIDIDSLAKLNAIRHDPDGNGSPSTAGAAAYNAAFPGAKDHMGCPAYSDDGGSPPIVSGANVRLSRTTLRLAEGAAASASYNVRFNADPGAATSVAWLWLRAVESVNDCAGYELTANLDFDTNDDSSVTSADAALAWGAGAGWSPIGATGSNYAAIFRGHGHTISTCSSTPPASPMWACSGG